MSPFGPLQVLLVEDSDEFALLARTLLRAEWGPELAVVRVDSLADARRRLESGPFDCVLLDLSLPDGRGLGLVREIQALSPEAALVVVTGAPDELGARAVREGAQDYLHKGDLDGPRLARAIRYAVERQRTAEELRRRALRDELTGLANRTLLFDRLELALARSTRGGSVAVLFLDLDGFKAVNDTLGHAAGDRLLIEVAARLRSAVRPGDTVARVGGDEFVVLCDALHSREEAMTVANRLAQAVGGQGTGDLGLSASIGVAFGRGPGLDGKALLAAADLAMYRSKAGDRAAAPAEAGAR